MSPPASWMFFPPSSLVLWKTGQLGSCSLWTSVLMCCARYHAGRFFLVFGERMEVLDPRSGAILWIPLPADCNPRFIVGLQRGVVLLGDFCYSRSKGLAMDWFDGERWSRLPPLRTPRGSPLVLDDRNGFHWDGGMLGWGGCVGPRPWRHQHCSRSRDAGGWVEPRGVIPLSRIPSSLFQCDKHHFRRCAMSAVVWPILSAHPHGRLTP